MNEPATTKLRIDKWLWAARFFKTRSLAKHAIEGGKVYCEGARIKVSKEISIGATLRVRQGYDEKTVRVLALSDKRGNATMAALLYEETEDSIKTRQTQAAQRKALGGQHLYSDRRPNKKERRKIQQFKQDQIFDE